MFDFPILDYISINGEEVVVFADDAKFEMNTDQLRQMLMPHGLSPRVLSARASDWDDQFGDHDNFSDFEDEIIEEVLGENDHIVVDHDGMSFYIGDDFIKSLIAS